ncbi:myosin heavy chain, embryonic smooth muscle isoform-like isoform X2 [Littorina saxatilis]|uniref:myosin heavy chain, embryonic smooth muscle isoform-like isoform X2 n=1 Tax=Littorina saxatilis TaxID=31220 RepID=UPI0038B69327
MESMEALFHKLQGDLTLAERERCNAEAERDELADQIGISKQCMRDEKRRLEVRISELEDELEDEHTNLEQANDKARKSMIAMEQMTSDLAAERSVSQKRENQRLALERQNKDMREKLQELEGQNRTRTKATIAALEGKIANLEDQLDLEAKERAALTRANHKMYKRGKELDERRSTDQCKEQADEAEEEVACVNAEKRKVQRDLDD